MRIVVIDDKLAGMNPSVATIGFFDGVHKGHQFLLDHLVKAAKKTGMESTVITFDAHPRKVLNQDYQPEMLSTLEEKQQLLGEKQIDNCVLLHFDKEMAGFSACEFMEKVLCDRLNVRKLYIGYDNKFGHNCEEGFDDYVKYGRELGIEVVQNPVYKLHDIDISSTYIRGLLKKGCVDDACEYLGYLYSITGEVIHGFQNGRKLGYPTANISIETVHKLIPANGVYAVEVEVEGCPGIYQGMMDIGTRPTFSGKSRSLEVNIFDFGEDIYGRQIHVSFICFIRPDIKFNNTDDLAIQLKKDEKIVREKLNKKKYYEQEN